MCVTQFMTNPTLTESGHGMNVLAKGAVDRVHNKFPCIWTTGLPPRPSDVGRSLDNFNAFFLCVAGQQIR